MQLPKPSINGNSMKTLRLLSGAAALLIALSCSRTDLDENGYPVEFKIGVATSSEDMQEVFRRMDPVREYLERELGVPVQYFRVNGYAPVIEALRAKKIHMGSLPPFAYLIAREKARVSPVYTLGLPDGKQMAMYQACIMTRKESGIATMADLKARAPELSLVFVDPASTSGHIAPRYHMGQHGILPERDFKSMVFANDHLSTILTLNSGKVDVSCNQMSTVIRLEMQGSINREDFNFVWISDALPSTAACIRDDISPEFKKKLLNAYLNIHNDSAAWSSIIESRRANYFGEVPLESLRYIAVTAGDYLEFEEMVRSTPGLKMQ
jgi:phosphonate transport system substrate-binding protein